MIVDIINSEASHRQVCILCRRSALTCYCNILKPFTSGIQFIILIHPKEHRKTIGTGRMTHRCIKNSLLIEGKDFTNNLTLNQIINNPNNYPLVLFPGYNSIDITHHTSKKLDEIIPCNRNLVVLLIDASWSKAKKILYLNPNINKLQKIKFTPQSPSIYKIRKQPKPICYSTIESANFIIERLKQSNRWPTREDHSILINLFKNMINQQLTYLS